MGVHDSLCSHVAGRVWGIELIVLKIPNIDVYYSQSGGYWLSIIKEQRANDKSLGLLSTQSPYEGKFWSTSQSLIHFNSGPLCLIFTTVMDFIFPFPNQISSFPNNPHSTPLTEPTSQTCYSKQIPWTYKKHW